MCLFASEYPRSPLGVEAHVDPHDAWPPEGDLGTGTPRREHTEDLDTHPTDQPSPS